MKSYRVTASCFLLASLIVSSISFGTQARVLLAQAHVMPATDSGFSASPISGAAALVVGFNYRGAGRQLKLDFGDGSSSGMNAAPICATCVPAYVTSHIYAAAGTYTATLSANGQVAATVTITVSNP